MLVDAHSAIPVEIDSLFGVDAAWVRVKQVEGSDTFHPVFDSDLRWPTLDFQRARAILRPPTGVELFSGYEDHEFGGSGLGNDSAVGAGIGETFVVEELELLRIVIRENEGQGAGKCAVIGAAELLYERAGERNYRA